MNKKNYIFSFLLISIINLILYFSCFISIYAVSKNDFYGEVITQTDLITQQYKMGFDEGSITFSYSDSDDERVSFINDGNIYSDSKNIYSDSSIEIVNSIYSGESPLNGIKYIYFVRYISSSDVYIRYGKIQPRIMSLSLDFLIYGEIASIILIVIYCIYINIESNKSLKPLKMQIRKLQNIINIERPVEYGDDLNYLALIVRDSRKELKAQFDLTKVGEQKINFILDSISQALVVIDSNYRIIMFNKKASEIFGVAKEEADEKSFEVLSKAKFLEGNVSMVIQTLRSFVYQEKIDGRIYQCNINPIDYSWTRVNEKPGASLLMIDITEEYNSSAMKREFFTNASHELKTPLTAILGYQQMMQQGVETSEEGRKELVSKTIKEATRMRKIIFDMLELSSLENESLRTVEKINVVSEIDNVLSSLDFEITQKHLTIEKNYSDMVLEINYDDFNRLIKNLLENAIFYNKENGKIFIVVDNFNKTISIADSGIGISEENINRIFERFFRVDKARSRRDGGTGLGLAIVKHICEYYGYEISVKSKIDEGSKFTITCK